MKLTKAFLQTMRNFASINSNMYFREGTVQSTGLFTSKNTEASMVLFARANIDVEIEKPFAVIDLINFLAAVKIFKEPDMTIVGNRIEISDDEKFIHYMTTNPDFISFPTDPNKYKLHDERIEIDLPQDKLGNVLEISGLLKQEYISFVGDGKDVAVELLSNGFSSSGSVYLGKTKETFKATLKTSNLKIYEGMPYKVSIVRKGYVHFQNDIFEYIIRCEKDQSEL